MRISQTAVLGGAVASVLASQVLAIDIDGVQPAALDQPRINAILLRSDTASSSPYTYRDGIDQYFNIQAFYDTGASGVMVSAQTAEFLGIPTNSVGGKQVIFEDVGVAGSDKFNVSQSLAIGVAPYHPDLDQLTADAEAEYSASGSTRLIDSMYNQRFGAIQTQIGPIDVANPDPLLEGLDVFGVPVMQGKVSVFDPKPVNTFMDTMRTYVYNPGTPYNAAAADSNPGIPNVDRHIKLSQADLGPYTQVRLRDPISGVDSAPLPADQAAAVGPTLRGNPFLGPNPVHRLNPAVPAGDSPAVVLHNLGQQTEGSFLLDTGAAASMVSTSIAAQLGVHYRAGTEGTDTPILEDAQGNALLNQFSMTIGGIGGQTKVAGFYIEDMLLRTQEGDVANFDDPNHIRFLNAPVLVTDITVADPASFDPQTQSYLRTMTLDGIFGMNLLVASALVTEGAPGELPSIDYLTPSAFDWVTYDQPNSTLGLAVSVPEPSCLGLLLGGVLLGRRQRTPIAQQA